MSGAVFLVNPASANGSTGRSWPEIAHRAAAAGLDGRALLSDGPGQLAGLARDAASDGASLLVVVGGDGTVNEVVSGLLPLAAAGRPVPELAILPRGTGKDFVRTFRIPAGLDEAIAVARDGEPRVVDGGRAECRSWAGEELTAWFANIASAGMSGAIARRANDSSKALGGRVSFLAATLQVFPRWRPDLMRLTVDGETYEARMRDVVVGNCRYFGGGMKMCPDALPDDGLFDVVTIGEATNLDLVLNMPKVYRGTHLPHPRSRVFRGAVVEVDADTPVPLELDGETPGTTPARFTSIPGALRVRAPRGAPLA
ncbi:MAG: diacylglycerol kinase family lipid kinase [Thermoleophilia bacterium]